MIQLYHDRSKWPVVPGSLDPNGKSKVQIFVENLRYFDANVLFFCVENLRYFELTRMCFFKDKTCHFNANVLLQTGYISRATIVREWPTKIFASMYFSRMGEKQ